MKANSNKNFRCVVMAMFIVMMLSFVGCNSSTYEAAELATTTETTTETTATTEPAPATTEPAKVITETMTTAENGWRVDIPVNAGYVGELYADGGRMLVFYDDDSNTFAGVTGDHCYNGLCTEEMQNPKFNSFNGRIFLKTSDDVTYELDFADDGFVLSPIDSKIQTFGEIQNVEENQDVKENQENQETEITEDYWNFYKTESINYIRGGGWYPNCWEIKDGDYIGTLKGEYRDVLIFFSRKKYNNCGPTGTAFSIVAIDDEYQSYTWFKTEKTPTFLVYGEEAILIQLEDDIYRICVNATNEIALDRVR